MPATGNFRAAVNCRSLVPFQNSSLSSSTRHPSALHHLSLTPPVSPSLPPLSSSPSAHFPLREPSRGPELPTLGHELIFERALRVVNIATGPPALSPVPPLDPLRNTRAARRRHDRQIESSSSSFGRRRHLAQIPEPRSVDLRRWISRTIYLYIFVCVFVSRWYTSFRLRNYLHTKFRYPSLKKPRYFI